MNSKRARLVVAIGFGMALVIALMCAISAEPHSSLVFASRLGTPTGRPTLDADRDGGGRDDPPPTPEVTPYGWLPAVAKKHPHLLDYPDMRGVAGPKYSTSDFEGDTWYNWGFTASDFDFYLTRMIWCASDRKPRDTSVPWYGTTNYSNTITTIAQADYANYRGRVWLYLNEPDDFYSENEGDAQCGWYTVTVRSTNEITRIRSMSGAQEMAHRYIETRDLILEHDPSAKVYPAGIMQPLVSSTSPGDCGEPAPCGGLLWWREFIHEISTTVGAEWREEIDGIHVHAYPGTIDNHDPPGGYRCVIDISSDEWCVDEAQDAMEYYYTEILRDEMGLQDIPIWVTETGAYPARTELSATYGIWSTQAYTKAAENIADPMAAWMTGEDNPGYDKLFWYVSWTDHDDGASWCTFLYTNTIWTAQTKEASSTLNPLGEAWAGGDW